MPNTCNKNIDETVVMPVIFMVETSNSITDSSSKAINETVEKCIDNLKTISYKGISTKDANIQIGILTCKEGWITGDTLVPVNDYSWKNQSFDRNTNSNIITELINKLTDTEFFIQDAYTPSIIVLTDGESSLWDESFSYNIHDLWRNKLYRSSNRFLISVNELKKEEIFVNLIREGTYLEIKDYSEETSKDLLTDLLLNTWSTSKIDIATKYQDSVVEKRIIIEK